jgi:hypothetical protein
LLIITITEEDKAKGGFSGRQTGGESTIDGRFGATTLYWTREVGAADAIGQKTQTWTVSSIEITKENDGRQKLTMKGTWRGAFQEETKAKGDDLEFKAVKFLGGKKE